MTTTTTMTVDASTGLNKLRAASCSVLLLLLTLALVASSLLVARYAVAASSWWLSLLAITVCLLGLCTWIQLAASRAGRAGRWRIMLARQMALSRAQRTVGGAMDLYSVDSRSARCGSASRGPGLRGLPHVAVIPLECELDAQAPYRVPGPPPPPPYALTDLPPSYCATAPGEDAPAAPAPPPGTEQPPPYAVAIKRDHLVQGAAVTEVAASPTPPAAAAAAAAAAAVPTVPSCNGSSAAGRASRGAQGRNRVVLWY